MLNLPRSVKVVEVSARDGLQSFHRWVETDDKIAMVDRLSEAGFSTVEVTNFAHPKVIPHLADAEEVMARIIRKPGVTYRAQAPNARGAERAVAAKADEILGLIAASEAYNRKNQNMSVEDGIEAAIRTFEIADRAGTPFVLAIAMAFFCPYEGLIAQDRVLDIITRLSARGIKRYYVAGSLGVEDPAHVNALVGRIVALGQGVEVGFHAHNLSGNGAANIIAALDAGASFVEGSVCGLGGGIVTPTTMGSVGNLATEDIVQMLNACGVDTGLDVDRVLSCARDVGQLLDIVPQSYLHGSGTREQIVSDAASHGRSHPR
jgi:hydroxymethylglutaryl-CoA lyase